MLIGWGGVGGVRIISIDYVSLMLVLQIALQTRNRRKRQHGRSFPDSTKTNIHKHNIAVTSTHNVLLNSHIHSYMQAHSNECTHIY